MISPWSHVESVTQQTPQHRLSWLYTSILSESLFSRKNSIGFVNVWQTLGQISVLIYAAWPCASYLISRMVSAHIQKMDTIELNTVFKVPG